MSILSRYELEEVDPLNCEGRFPKQDMVLETIPSNRIIGIEVEVENLHMKQPPISGAWESTEDGSLRNGGIEWISRPIEARWAPQALYELLVDDLDNRCCFGPRTSIHVHVNAQEMSEDEVLDTALLYSVVEPLLYRYTGRSRDKNIYCVPLYDTNLLYKVLNQNFDTIVDSWSKYTGFNLLPLRDHGTMEFRHMHGTFDHKKVSIWIRILTKLVDYVKNKSTKWIRETILKMDKRFNYMELFQDIFGEDLFYLKFRFYEEIQHGIDNARTSFLSPNTFHEMFRARDLAAPYFKGVK